tara:strand:+ start:1878 stop:2135 length:258 start_codon:yes stop_codon:yes gene_type:complete
MNTILSLLLYLGLLMGASYFLLKKFSKSRESTFYTKFYTKHKQLRSKKLRTQADVEAYVKGVAEINREAREELKKSIEKLPRVLR